MPLEALFGQRAQKLRSRVEAIGAEFGVELVAPTHAPSTVAPLAASERARELGALDSFREALMNAYWRDGEDIEDESVLARAASEAQLAPDEIIAAASAPEYIEKVTAARASAHEANVTAIPTLLVKGFPVVGCQPWETYERVATKLGLRRR